VTGASDWGAVLLIGLAGAAHQAFSANLFTTVSDSFPKQAVASVIGIGGMAGAIGGMLFPIVTGVLLDSYKAAGNVAAGYGILFAFCAGAYLFSLFILQILNPRLESVQIKPS
jgi:ACS family hexuronate transporter-like MFS transporter